MTNKDQHDLNGAWLSVQGEPLAETLTCDTDKYREHVENFDLSEQEQNELLQILWSIMAAFVDLGFGVDSIQFLPTETSRSAQADEGKQTPKLTGPDATPPRRSDIRKEIDHDG